MARRRRRSYNYFGGPVRERAPSPTLERLQARLGRAAQPVCGEGRKLAATFWGLAWCRNLEHYHDYANRLPRGRTYLRQGSVLDVDITRGRVTGLVLGTELYEQQIEIAEVGAEQWAAIRKRCVGKLGSAIDLLEGRMPDEVMVAVTQPGAGLFPAPREIRMRCSCPDWTTMCKHVAALLYGVGLRLDAAPELLFVLRGVSHEELVDGGVLAGLGDEARRIPAGELGGIFGVLIDDRAAARGERGAKAAGVKAAGVKKPGVKKPGVKKTSVKKFPNNRKWIGADELRGYGLSDAEIRQWVGDGYLLVVDGREDYRVLPEARRRLRERC